MKSVSQNLLFLAIALTLSGCGFYSLLPKGPGVLLLRDTPGIAQKIALLTPGIVELGICTEVTIQAQDFLGIPAPVVNAQKVELMILEKRPAKIFLEASCKTEIGSVRLAAGKSEAHFYVLAGSLMTFGTTVLSVALGLETRFMAVSRTPQSIAFRNAPKDTGGGFCSEAVLVELEDGQKQPIAASREISLSSIAETRFYPTSTCTPGSEISKLVFASETSKTFYFRSAKLGPTKIRLTASPLILEADVQILKVPYEIKIIGGPVTLTAGLVSSAPFEAHLQDSEGNDVAADLAIEFFLAESGGSAEFCEDSNCGRVFSRFNFSTSGLRPFYLRPGSPVASFPAITPVCEGLFNGFPKRGVGPTLPVNQSLEKLVLSYPGTEVALGQCSDAMKLTLQDGLREPEPFTPPAPLSFTFSPMPSPTLRYFSDPLCQTQITILSASTSISNFYFLDSDTNAHSTSFSVSLGNLSSNLLTLSAKALSLDKSFGDLGITSQQFGDQDSVVGVIPFNGGFLVAANSKSSGVDRMVFMKLNAQGKLDLSFNQTGKRIYICAGRASVNAILPAGTGFLATGRCDNKAIVLRILANGILDTSFGTNGAIHYTVLPSRNTAGLFAEGLALAESSNAVYAILRVERVGFRSTGIWSFGSNGTTLGFVEPEDLDHVTDVRAAAFQPTQNRLLLAGSASGSGYIAAFDSALNSKWHYSSPSGSVITAMKLNQSEEILSVGNASGNIFFSRLNASGSEQVFSVFPNQGKVSFAYGLDIYPDGKLLAVGQKDQGASAAWVAFRFDQDGNLDGASYENKFGGGQDVRRATGVSIGSDNRAVIAGINDLAQQAIRLFY